MLPGDVSSLSAIELNLNQNQLSVLPVELARCSRLKVLRLQENCLSLEGLPVEVLSSSQVSTLVVEGNLFQMKDLQQLDAYDKVGRGKVIGLLYCRDASLNSLDDCIVGMHLSMH